MSKALEGDKGDEHKESTTAAPSSVAPTTLPLVATEAPISTSSIFVTPIPDNSTTSAENSTMTTDNSTTIASSSMMPVSETLAQQMTTPIPQEAVKSSASLLSQFSITLALLSAVFRAAL